MLAQTAALLRCFNAQCATLSISEAAERLDLPKAATSRLMNTMCEMGLLETIGYTGRHRPGRMIHDCSAAFRASTRLLSAATDAVTLVCQQTGHTGFVAMRDGKEVTTALALPGTAPDRVPHTISRMPARRAATGRTLLARMDDAAVRRLYADLPERDLAALIARLDVIRDEGYDVSRSEAMSGVDVVAVAVCDPASRDAVSLCIIFPVDATASLRCRIIDGLLDAAMTLAATVGDDLTTLTETAA